MFMTNRFTLAFICLAAILFSTAGCDVVDDLFPPSIEPGIPVVTNTPLPPFTPEEPTTTEQESDGGEPEPIECVPLDADVRSQMDEIENQVATLRGLRPIRAVDRVLLTQGELRQRVIDDFLDDYTEQDALDDARVLNLFGLLEPGFDLWNFYVDLFSEQVAGFYDDTVEEMAIVCGTGFKAPERITFAHEFAHALQDQSHDFEEELAYTDETCELDSERCAALQALVEGDATLLEEQWLQIYALEQDLVELFEFFGELDTPVYDSAPNFIRQDLLFPYMAGRNFVNAIYLEGGWAAVDAAYDNPPLSTEQILHPERYPLEAPIVLQQPDLVDTLGADWREVDRDVLGEWFTQLVLDQHIHKADAADAAAGWGGDIYQAFYDERTGEGLLLLVTQWDTMRDVHEFYTAFREYGDARFGDRTTSSTYSTTWEGDMGYALLERSSNQTLWILSPNADTAVLLREALTFPVKQQ
jgi:hypothetical protein